MDKTITPITYEDAAMLLHTNQTTIRTTVSTGRLSRLPTTSTKAHLIKEQVDLFVGKKIISLPQLSSEELQLWHYYNDMSKMLANNLTNTSDTVPVSKTVLTDIISDAIRNATNEDTEKKTSFLSSYHDMSNVLDSVSFTAMFVVLILSIGLLWVLNHKNILHVLVTEKDNISPNLTIENAPKIASEIKPTLTIVQKSTNDMDTIVRTAINLANDKVSA